jgi:glycine cleavage system aminomethyltransferase T
MDGNGRIGRILIPLFLYEKKLLSSPVFYMSEYLESHRDEYYLGLREITEKGKIPRQHFKIKDAAGNEIGEVTSGTQSPSLNKAIGMGYVNTEFSKADSEIFILIRDKAIQAKVCKLPFLNK